MVRWFFVSVLLLCATSFGQFTLPPGVTFSGSYLGSSLNLPGPLGGIEFSADGSMLYCGTSANNGSGEIRVMSVIRNPVTNKITGFGQATVVAPAPGIDGGLQFHPTANTLFYTQFPSHGLGQVVLGGGPQTAFSLAATGIPGSTGSLEFVPAGLPNAGNLLVASYNGGSIYTVPLMPNGNGTFTPGTATLFAQLPAGSEGMRHIPSGPFAGSMAIINYSLGTIALLQIDLATGQPILGSNGLPILAPFISGITGPEGLAFDPITNDFFVSQFGGLSEIYQFSGFPALPSIGICGSGSVGVDAGGPYNVLTVNGSSGGPLRRVDIGFGVGITLALSTPPTASTPQPFILYGKISDLAAQELTPIANVGDFCFVPTHLFPLDPEIFVVANSYFPDPLALVPATLTPWSLTYPPGLNFPFTLVFQGAIADPSRPLGIAVTNGVILNVL